MKISSRPRRRRGQSLAIVLSMVVLFLIGFLALHHQQSLASTSLNRNESRLRFREAKNFAVRKATIGESEPWGLDVNLNTNDITPESTTEIKELYASELFARGEDGSWSGIPDIGVMETAPGHRYYEITPGGLSGFKGHASRLKYKLVKTEVPGYAIYAPGGDIHANEVSGWQNPKSDSKKDATKATSGVPAVVAAEGDIDVFWFRHGEAHSRQGKVEAGGWGLSFSGSLPYPEYAKALRSDILAARAALIKSAHNGNKTHLISGHSGTAKVIAHLFGEDYGVDALLSLRQAWNFPTPMIPGAGIVMPGIWEVWFHVPFQPDFAMTYSNDTDIKRLEEIAQDQKEAAARLHKLLPEHKWAKEEMESTHKTFKKTNDKDDMRKFQVARDKFQKLDIKLKKIQEFLTETNTEAKSIMEGKADMGMSETPLTRAQDPPTRKGQFGWNYSKTMGKMGELLVSVISGGDLEQIAASVSTDVRLVHYGPEDEVPNFSWENGLFRSLSTWTVPSSRTLRYDGDMEIFGDLWLQRGSVMVVDGDLTLRAPVENRSITNSFKPTGRLFLEEGSTLIVNGKFVCSGTPDWGSIMVAAEPGEIHPISSAIIVEGKAVIPYGIYAGHTLPDLVADLPFPGTKKAADQLDQLLAELAPLFSKLAGPFHTRNPYFARFATTFQIVALPVTPGFAITPIPMPKENLHVFGSRAESFAYAIGLNATLGENLYTQADWWPFGKGVVPMAHRLDTQAALPKIEVVENLQRFTGIDPVALENDVRDFAATVQERSLKWAFDEVTQKLIMEAARIIGPGLIVDGVQAAMTELGEDENDMDTRFKSFVGQLENKIGTQGRRLLSDLLKSADVLSPEVYLKEYSGLLLYANAIIVGPEARQVSGMFVAEEDVIINARLTVGTITSLNGSVDVRNMLFYPYFNQASLYEPLPVPGKRQIDRGMHQHYGSNFQSKKSVQIGPPKIPAKITSGGWD